MLCVPYHHPHESGYLSLRAVVPNRGTSIEHRWSENRTYMEVTEPSPGVFCIYAGDPEATDEELAVSPKTPLEHAVHGILTGVLENSESDVLKQYSLSDAVETIRDQQWRNPVLETGAGILSGLIRRHPFPNGNHRTSLAITAMYLATVFDCDPADTVHPGTVPDWLLNKFIAASKRWVTTARRAHVFEYALDHGIDAVERKNGVFIPLEYVLSENAVERHQSVCETLLRIWHDGNRPGEDIPTDSGFRAFRDRIEASSYDYTELGRAYSLLRD